MPIETVFCISFQWFQKSSIIFWSVVRGERTWHFKKTKPYHVYNKLNQYPLATKVIASMKTYQ